jgi:hypothetical protein
MEMNEPDDAVAPRNIIPFRMTGAIWRSRFLRGALPSKPPPPKPLVAPLLADPWRLCWLTRR